MRSFAAACILIATVLCARPVVLGQEKDLRCNYLRKVECTQSGCQAGEVGSAYLLLPHVDALFGATIAADRVSELPTIRRCDSKGCSPITVRASLSGAFVNITQQDGAYFMRIATVDVDDGFRSGDFVEVASIMLATITYYGSCPGVVK